MSEEWINKILGSTDIDMVEMKLREMHDQQRRLRPVVEQAYANNAEMLFKKFEALQTAGFKEDQAMQIVLNGVKL